MAISGVACKVCDSLTLDEILEFTSLPRVTSDCMPFRAGGTLAVCEFCGGVQALANERWLSDIREIYAKYQMYHQSGGVEQHVLDPKLAKLRPRSEVLLDQLMTVQTVSGSGSVLDVGCGTGGTLRAFSARGGWALYGLELDERNLPFLGPIPGFARLYTCSVRELPKQFDLITMVHALEHLPDPRSVLSDLQSKLSSKGRLFIQVPDASANPFDYTVADHMMHFTPKSLEDLLNGAGFTVESLSTQWVTKELSAVARPSAGDDNSAIRGGSSNVVLRQIAWLEALLADSRLAARSASSFGLFGTSIAATWLWQGLADRVDFFIEEDIHRLGRDYLGRPVLGPEQAPAGAVIVLALVPNIAALVRARLHHLPVEFRLPPPLTATV